MKLDFQPLYSLNKMGGGGGGGGVRLQGPSPSPATDVLTFQEII